MTRVLIVYHHPLFCDLAQVLKQLPRAVPTHVVLTADIACKDRRALARFRIPMTELPAVTTVGAEFRPASIGHRERFSDVAGISGDVLFAAGQPFIDSRIDAVKNYIDKMNRLFDSFRPDIIALFHEVAPLGRCVVHIARQRGVRTLLVQHAQPRHARFTDLPSYVDRICVMGDWSRRQLARSGVPVNRIVVTGQPRFDELSERKFDRAAILRKHDLPSGKKIVVFSTSHIIGRSFSGRIARILGRFTGNREDVAMIFKIHPNDVFENLYRKILADECAADRWRIIRNADIHEILFVSRLVVSSGGTTDLEAMIMKRPVIRIGFVRKLRDWEAVEWGAVIPAASPKILLREMANILRLSSRNVSSENTRRYLLDQCGSLDGRAARRVAHEILSKDRGLPE